ncbi:MAG: YCF48-related protein [bacterium]
MQATARPYLRIAGLIVLFGFGFVYLGGGDCDEERGDPAFRLLTTYPRPISLERGQSASYSIAVERIGGHQDGVTFVPIGAFPTDVDLVFVPNPVPRSVPNCLFNLTAHIDAAAMTHDFQVRAFTPTQSETLNVSLQITEIPPPAWNLIAAGTVDLLHDVHFPDAGTGYIVGDSGTILKSTNGGLAWAELVSGTSANLLGVHFTHPDTGTVVGYFGTILRTIDGGLNWTPQTGTTRTLDDVQFLDRQHGFAVGRFGTFLVTDDGGDNWAESNVTTDDLNTAWFHDELHGLVAGANGALFTTDDGGGTWTKKIVFDVNYHDLFFTDTNQGFLVGAPSESAPFNGQAVILRTPDGGVTWLPRPCSTTELLQGAAFRDENVGLVVGENGVIYATDDAGASWEQETSNVSVSLRAAIWLSGQRPFTVGGSGAILRRDE